MLFESSGGQVDRVAHLPELRFALGEPAIETTSVDSAAMALTERSYFLRRVGTDGLRISYQPTIRKVVNDRRASLDEEGEIQPAIRGLVKDDFDRGATIPRVCFPADAAAISDTPKLTLVVMDPEAEWIGAADDEVRKRIGEWTRARGASPRLYPGALVWAVKKPGRELRDKVEQWLAWKRVASEAAAGTLGTELDRAELSDIRRKVKEAADAAREEVWGDYRWMVIADASESDELKAIDLGAGHSSSSESLCGRVIELPALCRPGLGTHEPVDPGERCLVFVRVGDRLEVGHVTPPHEFSHTRRHSRGRSKRERRGPEWGGPAESTACSGPAARGEPAGVPDRGRRRRHRRRSAVGFDDS